MYLEFHFKEVPFAFRLYIFTLVGFVLFLTRSYVYMIVLYEGEMLLSIYIKGYFGISAGHKSSDD